MAKPIALTGRWLLKEELFVEENPDTVEPTYKCTAEGYYNTDDKANKSALLCECRPSYNNFGYPVNTGNEEKKKLNESALSVEPSHIKYLRILVYSFYHKTT